MSIRVFVAAIAVVLIQSVAGQSPTLTNREFIWSDISPPQRVGSPIRATVEARDSEGRVLSNLNAPLFLSARVPRALPGLFISELDIANERIEFTNPGTTATDASGWWVDVYAESTWPRPSVTYLLPPGTVAAAGSAFEVASIGRFPVMAVNRILSAYPLYFTEPFFWFNSMLAHGQAGGYPVAVLLRDRNGAVIDFVCAGNADPLQIVEAHLSAEWQGDPLPLPLPLPPFPLGGTYQRRGQWDHNDRTDWFAAAGTLGQLNPALRAPFAPDDISLQIEPAQVTLQNGRWTGDLFVREPATHVVLRADDGDGFSGTSNPFAVQTLPSLTLDLPGTISEGGPSTFTGVVGLPSAAATSTLVRLTSSHPADLVVSETVSVPAGATTATFTLNNLNNILIEGARQIEIVAEALTWSAARSLVTKLDDEIAALSLSLPARTSESAGWLRARATVSLDRPAGRDIRVQLRSSDTLSVYVSDPVMIRADQSTASFDLLVVDNERIDGTRTVSVTAEVIGWLPAIASIEVTDNENRNLVLQMPGEWLEGTGHVSAAGTVSITGVLPADLPVQLFSNRPERLQLPAQVIIPAGKTSAHFGALLPENSHTNGTQQLNVEARATGFDSDSREVLVRDNDVHHFTFGELGPAYFAGEPFSVEVRAESIDGHVIPTYRGPISISAASADLRPVPLQVTGAFTNGVWSGSVRIPGEVRDGRLLAAENAGRTGLSGVFDVSRTRILNWAVSDIVSHPQSGNLLVGLLASSSNAAAIGFLNPATGALSASIPLGSEPGKLALSDDGRFLYAALLSTGGVARVNLETKTIDLQYGFGEPHPEFGGPYAEDIAVLPGNSDAIAVSLRFGVGPIGEFIYDRNVARPGYAPPSSFNSTYTLEFGATSSNLYAIFPAGFRQLAVDRRGISVLFDVEGNEAFPNSPAFPGAYGGDIVFEQGRLYRTTGQVLDPERVRLLGQYPASGWVIPEAKVGRVYYLPGTFDGSEIHACDQNTFEAAGSLAIPGLRGFPGSFVRWGTDGFAFRTTSNQVVLVQSDLVPQLASTDLAVIQRSSVDVATVGSHLTYLITVSNLGPSTVTNATLVDWIPKDASLDTVLPSQGTWSFSNGIVTVRLGTLAAATVATIELTVRPSAPVPLVNLARVIGGSAVPGNDVSVQTNMAQFSATLPRITELRVKASDLAYDSVSNRLYVATAVHDGVVQSGIQTIDLSTGLSGSMIPLQTPAGRIFVSSGGEYIYAFVQRSHPDSGIRDYVERLNTRTRLADLAFPIRDFLGQAHSLLDLEAVPGDPNSVAVAQSGPQNDVEIYRNGTPVKRSDVGLNCRYIEFSSSGTELFGVNFGPDSPLFRMNVTPSAITMRPASLGVLTGFDTDIKYAGGLLYATSGEVIDPGSGTRVSQFPVSGLVQPDLRVGRVFFVSQQEAGLVLTACDRTSLTQLWSIRIPALGRAVSLVRCGPGVLALTTSADQLFILNTALMPGEPVADLTIQQVVSAGLINVNETVTFTSTVQNLGPDIAREVVLTNIIPPGTLLESVTVSQGTFREVDGQLRCEMGTLASNATAQVTLVLRAQTPGTLRNVASVSQLGADPVAGSNLASAITYVAAPATNGIRMIELITSDLAYDRVGGKIYAGTPDGIGSEANSLIQIDPVTSGISAPIPLGRNPGRMAVSDDSQFLYVALEGEAAVAQFNLRTQTVERRIPIPDGLGVEDIEAAPGNPRLIALSRVNRGGGSPRHYGVYAFENGVQRPSVTLVPAFANTLAFSDSPELLFGYDNETSGYAVTALRVDSNGVSVLRSAPGLVAGSDVEIEFAAGRLYATTGSVIDPVTLQRIGLFTGPGLGNADATSSGALIEPDPGHGLVYFLVPDGVWKLKAYDLNTFQPVGSLSFPSVQGKPSSLLRFGQDGIAFRTSGGQVFLADRSKVQRIDLSLNQTALSSDVLVGSEYVHTLTLTNRSRAKAENVAIQLLFPPNAQMLSFSPIQGEVTLQGNVLTARFGEVPPAGTATLILTNQALAAGLSTYEARILTDGLDTNLADNSHTLSFTVRSASGPGLINLLSLAATDIVYDSARDQIIASVGSESGAVVSLDPNTHTFGTPIPIGPPIGRLAISDDGSSLFAGTSTGGVTRLNLARGEVDLTFGLGQNPLGAPLFVGDMQVMPGRPNTIAVSLSQFSLFGPNAALAIYDSGIMRSNVVPAAEFGGVYPLRFASAERLYSTYPFTLRKIRVDAGGATLLNQVQGIVPDYNIWFSFDEGLAYFYTGRVVHPEQETIVGESPLAGLIVPDTAHDRIYVLSQEPSGFGLRTTIRTFRADRQTLLWTLELPGVSGNVVQFIPCSHRRLTFRTDANQLGIIRVSDVPTEPTADLSLAQTVSSGSVPVESRVSWSISVSNQGPWTAPNVLVTNWLSAGALPVSMEASQGSFIQTNGILVCALGDLASGGTASINLVTQLTSTGAVQNTATAFSSNAIDLNPANNTATTDLLVGPPVRVSIGDLRVREGQQAFGLASHMVRLSAPSPESISIGVVVTDGSARAGSDYDLLSQSVVFQPGQTNAIARLRIRGDTLVEADETYSILLTNASNAIIEIERATGTILNDDFAQLAVSNTSGPEGSTGTNNLIFSVTLAGGGTEPVMVEFATADGTARAGRDYMARAGTLLFPAGVTNKSITVPVLGNRTAEPDKGFYLTLKNPSNAVLSASEASGTILNDDTDGPPELVAIEVTDLAVFLQFTTVPGRIYRLESSSDLNTWTPLSGEIPGTESNPVEVRMDLPPDRQHHFYRALILP